MKIAPAISCLRRLSIFVTAGAWLLAGAAHGGETIELGPAGDVKELVRPHSVIIHNGASQRMTFYLATESGNETRHELAGNDLQEFSDGASSRYVIRVPTSGGGSVRYVLTGRKRYQIYWNAAAHRWDVTELLPR